MQKLKEGGGGGGVLRTNNETSSDPQCKDGNNRFTCRIEMLKSLWNSTSN